jgi:hypothetical protein
LLHPSFAIIILSFSFFIILYCYGFCSHRCCRLRSSNYARCFFLYEAQFRLSSVPQTNRNDPCSQRSMPLPLPRTVIRSAFPLARGPYLISHSSIGLPFSRSFSFRIMWLIMDLYSSRSATGSTHPIIISPSVSSNSCVTCLALLILFASPTHLFSILHYMRCCSSSIN